MGKKLWAFVLSALLLNMLVGCNTNANSTPSKKEEAKIKQAYLVYTNTQSADDITFRTVWHCDGIYGLYVDSSFVYPDELRLVQIEECNEDGTPTEKIHCFWFPNRQILYIYKDSTLYTIEEAYHAGVLTQSHLHSLQADEVYQNYILPDELKLSQKKVSRVKQAYLGYINSDLTAENVVLHTVLCSDDTYILYAHLLGEHSPDVPQTNTVLLNGESGYYGFNFVNNRQLYVYKDGDFYTLEEAWDANVLTSDMAEALLSNDLYKNSPGYWGY